MGYSPGLNFGARTLPQYQATPGQYDATASTYAPGGAAAAPTQSPTNTGITGYGLPGGVTAPPIQQTYGASGASTGWAGGLNFGARTPAPAPTDPGPQIQTTPGAGSASNPAMDQYLAFQSQQSDLEAQRQKQYNQPPPSAPPAQAAPTPSPAPPEAPPPAPAPQPTPAAAGPAMQSLQALDAGEGWQTPSEPSATRPGLGQRLTQQYAQQFGGRIY